MDKFIYIKINDSKGEASLTSGRLKGQIENVIIKFLSAIVPKANPDFEHLLDKVDMWKIEYDRTKNTFCREIGFDKDGNSIMIMPIGNNYGFWIDNNLTLDDIEYLKMTRITVDEFENDWIRYKKKNKEY